MARSCATHHYFHLPLPLSHRGEGADWLLSAPSSRWPCRVSPPWFIAQAIRREIKCKIWRLCHKYWRWCGSGLRRAIHVVRYKSNRTAIYSRGIKLWFDASFLIGFELCHFTARGLHFLFLSFPFPFGCGTVPAVNKHVITSPASE